MKTALITGASTGIGYEFCKLFAKDEYNLVITARNEDVLEKRAGELRSEFGVQVEVLSADLAEPGAAEKLVDHLKKRYLEIDVLVNNAGFGVSGAFSKTSLKEELDLLQVNIVALTALTKLLLPSMLERGFGHILNVASTAGFVPGPGMAVYYASKAYVISFSEALANELHGTGVSVTVLCPGPTLTEFQKRAGMADSRLFKVTKPMSAARAARKGYFGMQRGQVVVIPGITNKLMAASSRIIPRELVAPVVRAINEPL